MRVEVRTLGDGEHVLSFERISNSVFMRKLAASVFVTEHFRLNHLGLDVHTFGCWSGGKSESQARMKSKPFSLACFQRWTKRSPR
jgi:hypothetical protein